MKSLQASTWFPSSHLLLTKRSRKKILFKLPLHLGPQSTEIPLSRNSLHAATDIEQKQTGPRNQKKKKNPRKIRKAKRKEEKKKEKKTGLISITTLKGYRRVPLK